MALPGDDVLLDALLALLAPVTRWLHPPLGAPSQVNADGVDVHVGAVDDVHVDAGDGRVHAYIVIWPGAGTWTRTRLAGPSSVNRWGFTLTVAGGDNDRASWALGKVRPLLDDARLIVTGHATGPLIEQQEAALISRDDDVDPPRWYTTLQYACTAH